MLGSTKRIGPKPYNLTSTTLHFYSARDMNRDKHKVIKVPKILTHTAYQGTENIDSHSIHFIRRSPEIVLGSTIKN